MTPQVVNPLVLDADSSTVKHFVKQQQAQRVLSVYDPTLLMQAFFILVSAWVTKDVIETSTLLAWIGLQCAVLVARKFLMMWHVGRSTTAILSGAVEKATLGLVVCSSLLWGSVAFVLNFDAYPHESVFLIAVNLGIGVGSTVLGAIWYRYYVAYVIPFMSLFILAFLFGVPERSITLACVFFGFAIYLTRMVQMNYENNVENLALRKKNEILAQSTNQFIAAASHDLRQPTQALSLFISALESDSQTLDKKQIFEQLKLSSHALNELLNQILDVSKLNANSLETVIEPVSLEALFARLDGTFSIFSVQKGVSLTVESNDLWVMTDVVLFDRLLSNLLDNAVTYTDAGTITLTAVKQEDDLVMIQVQDTGIGINADEQTFVFDPFYQVNNAARNREKGVGLGLSIVKLTSQKLDIPLTLSSELGQGSTFSLLLPIAEPVIDKAPQKAESMLWSLSGKRVLIIDDNEGVREGLASQLSAWGMLIMQAEGNNDALLKLQANTDIDLVISDYRLEHKQTGIEVIQNIRNQLQNDQLPAIVLSGDTAPERLDEVNQHGFTLLHKPIKAAQLRAAIQRELANNVD